MDLKNYRIEVYLLIVFIWAAMYLPGLGKPEFKGEEGRRTFPAINMLDGGSWVAPRISGQDYYNKPPGINWIVALSFVVTGERSEFAARLPSAVFILIFISIMIWYRADWLSLRARLIASIVFLTSGTMVEKGRQIELEAIVTCLTGIATFYWLVGWRKGLNRWRLWLVTAVILAFSGLVKGPFVPFFFYCTIFPVILYEKKLRELFTLAHIVNLVIIAGVFLGWFFLAKSYTSGEALTTNMWAQLAGRFEPANFDLPHWGKEILDSLVNFLPWTLFLPTLWNRRLTENIPEQDKRFFKGCRSGLVLGFVLIIMMPAMESRYSIPLFAIASILIGWALSLQRGFLPSDEVAKKIIIFCFALAPLAGLAGLILLKVTGLGIFAVVVAVIAFTLALRRRELICSSTTLCLSMAGLIVVLILQYQVFGIPALMERETFRPVGVEISQLIPEDETAYAYRPRYQTFLYYVREPIVYLNEPEEIDENVKYMIVMTDVFEKLKENPNFMKRHPVILRDFEKRVGDAFVLVKLQQAAGSE